MCAIFGSLDRDRFEYLYSQNLCRGSSAFGSLSYNIEYDTIVKKPGKINISDYHFYNEKYYLGHTQAPTSSAQTFMTMTSHPFMRYQWVVAHNGVLTNFDDLKLNIPEEAYNVVDSSIIPALLYEETGPANLQSEEDEVECILQVLKKLKGTYSLWIFNRTTRNIFICRCGSTLFLNKESTEFSSVNVGDMVEIEDGSLYKLSNNKFIKVGTFESNSPFFILD